MSRGNYYYAKGWVSSNTSGFTSGGMGRLESLGDSIIQSLGLFVIGAVMQSCSTVLDISMFSSFLPIFSLTLGIVGVIAILQVTEKGLLYVGGWTFVSLLLYASNIIRVGALLINLIPLGILVVYMLYDLS